MQIKKLQKKKKKKKKNNGKLIIYQNKESNTYDKRIKNKFQH